MNPTTNPTPTTPTNPTLPGYGWQVLPLTPAGEGVVETMVNATSQCRVHLAAYTQTGAPAELEAALDAYREAIEAHDRVWQAYGEEMSQEVFDVFCDAETLSFAIHQTVPNASTTPHFPY